MFQLATGKKTVKELPMMKQTSVSQEEYLKWLGSHTSLVRELMDYHMTTYELVSSCALLSLLSLPPSLPPSSPSSYPPLSLSLSSFSSLSPTN